MVVHARTPFESLEIRRDGQVTVVPVSVVVSPGGPTADLVFVTVKAADTGSTAPHLAATCGPATLTVVVQNGLDQASRVAPFLDDGTGPATTALAYVAAEREHPGRVHHIHGNLLVVDEAHAATVGRAVSPGMRVRGSADMATECWRKLLGNLVANPITALTQRHMDVMASPGIGGLARSVLMEAVAVGRAEGADLSESEVDGILERMMSYGSETASSMYYDRMAGRPMEHQYLTGEVVRRGAAHGIAVPVNATMLALLGAIDNESGDTGRQG